MPRYDYECSRCETTLTLKLSVAEYEKRRSEKHPHVGTTSKPCRGVWKRVFSTFTFHMGPA